MIEELITSIGVQNLEKKALICHRPLDGTYVYVNEDGNYKVIQNWEKVSFNSKYRGWDYYSQLVSINKPIASKLIQSNNYNTFWCRNIEKLKIQDIDKYFDVLKDTSWHREWVKAHIYELGKEYKGSFIKIFFPDTREEYRRLGLENWLEKSISIPTKCVNKEDKGVPIGYSINIKKPYSTGRTPYLVDKEKGLQIKMVYDILKGNTRRGYPLMYATSKGLYATTVSKGPEIDLPASLCILTKINSRGEIEFKICENIPSFRCRL